MSIRRGIRPAGVVRAKNSPPSGNLMRSQSRVQHHVTAQRIRQGGDQKAVIAPCKRPGHRAGGIAAKAVGDQPFLIEVRVGIGLSALNRFDNANWIVHESTRFTWFGSKDDCGISGQAASCLRYPAGRCRSRRTGIFARPHDDPARIMRRRQERFGRGIEMQIAAEIDQESRSPSSPPK